MCVCARLWHACVLYSLVPHGAVRNSDKPSRSVGRSVAPPGLRLTARGGWFAEAGHTYAHIFTHAVAVWHVCVCVGIIICPRQIGAGSTLARILHARCRAASARIWRFNVYNMENTQIMSHVVILRALCVCASVRVCVRVCEIFIGNANTAAAAAVAAVAAAMSTTAAHHTWNTFK